MLILVLITVSILVGCLILHYRLHFQLQTCCSRQSDNPRTSVYSIGATDSFIMVKGKVCKFSVFTSIDDDDELNFFPKLFVFYILLLLFLCIMIIIDYNYVDFDKFTDFTHIILDVHISSIYTYTSYNSYKTLHRNVFITDWILIYGILALCVFESFFSFYRICIIKKSEKLKSTSFMKMSKKFSIYCIVFVILFISQIHIYYWLWPILFLSHFFFNFYCNIRFASYLITKYTSFSQLQNAYMNQINYDILSSVYFMRRTILTCCVLQSFYFTAFIFLYDINVVKYYLPLFWSVSSIFYTINFVRDRQYIKHSLLTIYQCIKYNKICNCNCSKRKTKQLKITVDNIAIEKQKQKVDKNIEEKADLDLDTVCIPLEDPVFNTYQSATYTSNIKAAHLLGLIDTASMRPPTLKSSRSLQFKKTLSNKNNMQTLTVPVQMKNRIKLNAAKSSPTSPTRSTSNLNKEANVGKRWKFNLKLLPVTQPHARLTLDKSTTTSSPVVCTPAPNMLNLQSGLSVDSVPVINAAAVKSGELLTETENKNEDDEFNDGLVVLEDFNESGTVLDGDDENIVDDSIIEQMMDEVNDLDAQVSDWRTSINEVVDTMNGLVDLGYCNRTSISDLKHLAMYQQQSYNSFRL